VAQYEEQGTNHARVCGLIPYEVKQRGAMLEQGTDSVLGCGLFVYFKDKILLFYALILIFQYGNFPFNFLICPLFNSFI
jgi:hypothetical protein